MVLEENRSLAEHALKIIQEIYRTEHFADSKEYTPEERRELRNRQSAPLCWIPLKSGWKAHIYQGSAQKPDGTGHLLCVSVMAQNEGLSQRRQYKDRQ